MKAKTNQKIAVDNRLSNLWENVWSIFVCIAIAVMLLCVVVFFMKMVRKEPPRDAAEPKHPYRIAVVDPNVSDESNTTDGVGDDSVSFVLPDHQASSDAESEDGTDENATEPNETSFVRGKAMVSNLKSHKMSQSVRLARACGRYSSLASLTATGKQGSKGRLVFNGCKHSVAVYESPEYGPPYAQNVTDAYDSACWFMWYNCESPVVGDHYNQGFDIIKSSELGEVCYVVDGNRYDIYECVDVDSNGLNERTNIFTSTGFDIMRNNPPGYLYMYTCNQDSLHVTIVTWKYVNEIAPMRICADTASDDIAVMAKAWRLLKC